MGDVNLMRGVVQLMLEDKMPSPLSPCAEINIFSLTSFGSDSLTNHQKEKAWWTKGRRDASASLRVPLCNSAEF